MLPVAAACQSTRTCPQILTLFLVAFSLLSGCGFFAPAKLHAQFPTEEPKGYVSDFAGVLSPAMRQQLEKLCTELDQKTKAQLAIVTVRSLQGRPLEEFTIDLATKWGIGPKESDRGVMLFLAIEDRRSRIEVGYGLEPIIPDGKAGSILRSMTPSLRNGDYDGAMLLGARSIAQTIIQEGEKPSLLLTRGFPGGGTGIILAVVFAFLLLCFVFSSAEGRFLGGSFLLLATYTLFETESLRDAIIVGFIGTIIILLYFLFRRGLFSPRSEFGLSRGLLEGGGLIEENSVNVLEDISSIQVASFDEAPRSREDSESFKPFLDGGGMVPGGSLPGGDGGGGWGSGGFGGFGGGGFGGGGASGSW